MAHEEGCAPIRRGLLDHYPALGAYGVALYTWLILKMNPQTRRVETTIGEMRDALGTGPNQVGRTLKYLEDKGYIAYLRGSGGYKSVIYIQKPKCPTTGIECPLASNDSPCLSLIDIVHEVADEVRAEEQGASAMVLRVYRAWQDAGAMRHKRLTEKMGRAIKKAVKDYGEDMVVEAIKNYATIVHGDEYWFSYRWTLTDFLSRGDGKNIDRFCTDSDPFTSHRRESSTSTTANNDKYANI